ncbi:PREDICTED: unconventional myosin-XVB-like, partial [Priapulus caudatus]|uniref:Unconventional myosin-XVB-like n=1 Tax=Priapulus caudatus TaxID=37621 RepID=A0ABM1F5S2_PRICU
MLPDDERSLERMRTQLYAPSTSAFFSYNKVPWELHVRKEVFSPGEKFGDPLVLDLVFRQIYKDVMSNTCIRINRHECRAMRNKL